ncbi:MAG TPA: SDR family oxidoreductase [Ferrovibrio sp.]|jgi:NAD(P)-dependent dehydrogenase (short-subunit alcohol dehydrogenase family)|uniref:SDR family oxidoreductase n=1 Tax=Ferrovibrio sp. TaxID=1917215 RepID=UPI002B4B1692|nr:SDR family oxidoreductase [Ferrovibrio sp.]HLT77819.1 SDR family oxidoreductase [Ferrovibrio sp.]
MTQSKAETARPPQQQNKQPGSEKPMRPRPQDRAENYRAAGKLEGKVALITGGDSGIGRSTAIAMAKEGADIAFAYLDEHDDAAETERLISATGRSCKRLSGDLASRDTAVRIVEETLSTFGKIDILINNAAEQHVAKSLTEIDEAQLKTTFGTNIFAMFFLTQTVLPHLKKGAAIINTTSITAFHGHPVLIDYASTKGAIVAFTRSMAKALVDQGIRVNAVAPGPVWTPLIPASFSAEEVAKFGNSNPMGRAAEADEISPCYVFLASEDAAFMTGQVLHPNGGEYMA